MRGQTPRAAEISELAPTPPPSSVGGERFDLNVYRGTNTQCCGGGSPCGEATDAVRYVLNVTFVPYEQHSGGPYNPLTSSRSPVPRVLFGGGGTVGFPNSTVRVSTVLPQRKFLKHHEYPQHSCFFFFHLQSLLRTAPDYIISLTRLPTEIRVKWCPIMATRNGNEKS